MTNKRKSENVSMKIFKAEIDITCGEYGFLDTRLIVAENSKQACKKAKDIVKEENSTYPGETYYKLDSVSEFNFVDNYQLHYQLEKI